MSLAEPIASSVTHSSDPYVQGVLDEYRHVFSWASEPMLKATALSVALHRAERAVLARQEDFLARYKLTPARYRTVRTLFLANAPLPLNQISRKLQVTMAHTTKHVDWLEQRGWLQRVAHPTDRRVIYARLTPEGLDRLQTMFPALFEMTMEKWDVISDDDQDHLLRILGNLRVSLDAGQTSAPFARSSESET